MDNNNATIIHYYAQHVHITTILIQSAVEHGVIINARDNKMRTPLMVANPHAMEALIENGADVTERDKEGRTALHHLMMSQMKENGGSEDFGERRRRRE